MILIVFLLAIYVIIPSLYSVSITEPRAYII